ncbi:hypothetical protein HZC32_03185, partial [Candidatus Woesearchaeota archaeon]|nr:hypothetical protein [Candidatus Woesearchaeota archaeon]
MERLPKLDERMLKELKDPDNAHLLSIRRDSVTFLLDKPEKYVLKSYAPDQLSKYLIANQEYQQKKAQIHSDESLYDLAGLAYADFNGVYYFHKEAFILDAAGMLPDSDFVPKLKGIDRKTSSFGMEYIEMPDFRKHFLPGNNRKKKIEEFIDSLIKFHCIVGKNFKELYNSVHWKNTSGLRPRNLTEETARMENYFSTIIYRNCDQFGEYYANFKRKKSSRSLTLQQKINRAIGS